MAIDNQNMDDATQAYWQQYIDILKPLLRIQDWNVILCREAPENESHGACIGCFFGQKKAEMNLNLRHFYGLSPFDQKVTIVHELMHLHTHRQKDVVRKFCESQDESTHSFFWDMYYEEYEEMSELLAQVIAPFMPDPEVVVGELPTTIVSY